MVSVFLVVGDLKTVFTHVWLALKNGSACTSLALDPQSNLLPATVVYMWDGWLRLAHPCYTFHGFRHNRQYWHTSMVLIYYSLSKQSFLSNDSTAAISKHPGNVAVLNDRLMILVMIGSSPLRHCFNFIPNNIYHIDHKAKFTHICMCFWFIEGIFHQYTNPAK